MVDEPRILGTQHLQRSVDDLARVASTLRGAAEAMRQASQGGRAGGYPSTGIGSIRDTQATGWKGAGRGFLAGWNGSTPSNNPDGWRGTPNGGHATLPGMSGGGGRGGGGGAGGTNPFAGLPQGQGAQPFPRMAPMGGMPPRPPYPPPGPGSPNQPGQPSGGGPRRIAPYVGYMAHGASNALSNYAASSGTSSTIMEEQLAREFPTAGGMRGGSFNVGTTSSMARSMFGRHAYGQGTGDIAAGNEVIRTTLGLTLDDPRRRQFEAAGQGLAYMHPEMAYTDIQRARAGFQKAGTANYMRQFGIQTVRADGSPVSSAEIGDQISKKTGIQTNRKMTGAQIAATFDDQKSFLNENLQGMVASGQMTQEQADLIRAEQRDTAVAYSTAGWSKEKFRSTAARAAFNTKDGRAAQKELDDANIKLTTNKTEETNRESIEREKEANLLGGFSKGMQDANIALGKFTDLLNKSVYGPLGAPIGYTSGAKGVWDNGGEAKTLLNGALKMTGSGRILNMLGLGGGGDDGTGAGFAAGSSGGVQGSGGSTASSPGGVGGALAEDGGSKQAVKRAVKLIRPIRGPITSPYGMRVHPIKKRRSMHTGIDIGAPNGTPIAAAGAGVVTKATSNGGAYGKQTVIDHGDGISTMYGHQSSQRVKVGQRVTQGFIIGGVGSTGLSNGNHLHFEVWRNGSPVNPTPYIGGAGGMVGSAGAAGSSLAGSAGATETEEKAGQISVKSSGSGGLLNAFGSVNEADAIAAALNGGAVSPGNAQSSSESSTSSGENSAGGNAAGSGVSSGPRAVEVSGSAANRNAATIINVGKRNKMSNRDILIGLMTAMQESKLKNLANKTYPESLQMNAEGVGSDHDSLGLFQQRPQSGWGSPEELMNPNIASDKFFDALRRVGNRNNMRLTRAAQAVQRSRYPDAYAQWENPAKAIMAKYKMNSYSAGAWEVKSNELAQLHEGEMVVKRQTAKTIRDALLSERAPVRPGGSGEGVTLRFDTGSVVFKVEGAMTGQAAQDSARQFVEAIAKDARIKKIASGV